MNTENSTLVAEQQLDQQAQKVRCDEEHDVSNGDDVLGQDTQVNSIVGVEGV